MPTSRGANLTMTQADSGVHVMGTSVTDSSVMGVLALELAAGSVPTMAALPQAQASNLLELLARDLGKLVPGATALELSLGAAHFDPAEVLRPGWPLHRRLDELRQRAPGREQGPRVIAFSADEQGNIPLPLVADAALAGGQMRVLPFLLSGPAGIVDPLRDSFEEILLDRGMAGADAALLAQEAFGARIEHARYLTLHDLTAIMAMQYQNQGLQKLWPVIETALLAPGEEEWLDQPPEPLLRYAEGGVQIALLDPAAWQQRHATGLPDDVDQLQRGYEYFQARQRQIAAVLEAHGIPVTFAYCDKADVRESLKA